MDLEDLLMKWTSVAFGAVILMLMILLLVLGAAGLWQIANHLPELFSIAPKAGS